MPSTRKTNPKHSVREISNQLNRLVKGNESGHFLDRNEKKEIQRQKNFYKILGEKLNFKEK